MFFVSMSHYGRCSFASHVLQGMLSCVVLIMHMFLREPLLSTEFTGPTDPCIVHGIARAMASRAEARRRGEHTGTLVFRRRAACAARSPNPVSPGMQHDRRPPRRHRRSNGGPPVRPEVEVRCPPLEACGRLRF